MEWGLKGCMATLAWKSGSQFSDFRSLKFCKHRSFCGICQEHFPGKFRKTEEKGIFRTLEILAISLSATNLINPHLSAQPNRVDPTWEFGEGVDSARGVAAIVVCCRNSSCNSSCDAIARNG